MKKLKPRHLWAILVLFLNLCATSGLQAQVSGTVFRDYNGNGTQDANEPFMPADRAQSTVFVDAQVAEAEVLLKAAEPQDEVFHLFSHGRPGELLIEGQWLGARDIAAWLIAKGLPKGVNQINLYGCEFAQGPIGLEAIQLLEQATGLRVAASSNITGIGGDWVLEVGHQSLLVEHYSHSLQGNLLSNGSFGSVDIPRNSASNTATITDWTRSLGAVYLADGSTQFGRSGPGSGGGQYIIFDGVAAIQQTFTAPGPGFYRFYVARTSQQALMGNPDENPVQVRIDGNVIGTIFPSTRGSFDFQFQLASGGSHIIELRSTVSSGSSVAAKLSGVAVGFRAPLPADPADAVSGTVFRDYNGNGLQEANEPLMPGITVNAYNAANALCGTAITTGGLMGPNYRLTGCGTGPVRVEFVLPNGEVFVDAGLDYSSQSGNTYGTSVQFVNGNSADVNFAISTPVDYNTGRSGVDLYLPCYVNGDPTAPGSPVGAEPWFVGFDYQGRQVNKMVDGSVQGATWGVAYSKQADRVFTSAVIKRHIGLGTMGSGGIYMLEPTATSFNVTPFFDMDNNSFNTASNPVTRTRAAATAVPYGEGTSYSFVSDREVAYLGPNDPITNQPEGLGVVGSNIQRGLGTSAGSPSYDPATFDQVGKVGLGGLEISDDGRFLFVMNLYSRSVFRLELDDAYNPTSVINVTEITLPAISCADGEFRPWALAYERGKLYAGGLCSGEDRPSSSRPSGLFANVFELDSPETATAFAATPVLLTPLDLDYSSRRRVWSNVASWVFPPITSSYVINPSFMFTDLTFGNNGQMIMNFADRFGFQQSSFNRFPLRGRGDLLEMRVEGDIVIAGRDAATGNYQLESNGRYTSNGATYGSVFSSSTAQSAPFFFRDAGGFSDNTLGASVYLPGESGVTATNFDASSQRAYDLSLIDGRNSNGFIIASGGGIETKGLGLGEMELSRPDAPLEIGNRVWLDTNEDGIQDPDEVGIPGIEVQLWKESTPGTFTQIATVTTDADGSYFFTSATGTDVPGITYGVSMLLPNMNYELRFPATATVGPDVFSLTDADMGGTDPNADARDSDADPVGVVPFMTAGAGANDHTFDVGYRVGVANLEMEKTFVSATPNNDGTFTVDYTITVMETGGVATTYDLTDTPGFDDDVTINSGGVTGQVTITFGSPTNGTTETLATNEPIIANATHTYNLSFNVTLDLMGGGGDNIYTPCDGTTPTAGQGLYNLATITTGGMSGDDDDCGDLSVITHEKALSSLSTINGDGSYDVVYTITVSHLAGIAGQYDLNDIPNFDDDVTINNANYTSSAPPGLSGPLSTTMGASNVLGDDVPIAIGATHTYTINFNVSIDLTDGVVGDDVLTTCGTATPGTPQAGEGLFNQSTLDLNNDGTPEEIREVCTFDVCPSGNCGDISVSTTPAPAPRPQND